MTISRSKSKKSSAYTLVELLVVIGVLLIGFSFIYIGTGAGDGAKLSSAQRTLSGLVKSARAQAILKNKEVRLIIHNNPADIEKYRRYVGIVYLGTDSSDATGWIAATQGTYLPKGIYYNAAASDAATADAIWDVPTMNINYPRRTVQTLGDEYIYYEFNKNGASANPNAYLVFQAGVVEPGSGLSFPAAKSEIKSGLIIRRGGNATFVDDPAQL